MYIDASLNVNTKDGAKITTVEEALPSFGKNIIPAFYVKDNDTAKSIADYLKSKNILDALIISPDASVAKYALEQYSSIRNAVDFSGITDELNNDTLFNIRATTTGANSRIAIIPMRFATSDAVYYLHRLGLAVWVINDNVNGKTDIATMITSGVNGIISNKYKDVADAFVNLFAENTLTRTTLIVGHRGNPTLAPENTISSYLKAIENGADIVETDVYLTLDNHIIIMHDGTLERTTNSDSGKNITQMTLEEIKQYYCWGASDQFKSQYPDEKVPTLDELFEAIKDKDTVVFLEIKDGRVDIIQPLADLIKNTTLKTESLSSASLRHSLQEFTKRSRRSEQASFCPPPSINPRLKSCTIRSTPIIGRSTQVSLPLTPASARLRRNSMPRSDTEVFRYSPGHIRPVWLQSLTQASSMARTASPQTTRSTPNS
jgi:glycerophosphoryl diester phosphodiesterase